MLRSMEWKFFTDVSGQRIFLLFKGQAVLLYLLTLEYEPDRLSRNVDTELQFYAAWYPRRA
jgi:hypothetical protein